MKKNSVQELLSNVSRKGGDTHILNKGFKTHKKHFLYLLKFREKIINLALGSAKDLSGYCF